MTTDGKFIQITGQNIMDTKSTQVAVRKVSLTKVNLIQVAKELKLLISIITDTFQNSASKPCP